MTPDQWFAQAREAYDDVVTIFASYGVHPHPELEFGPGDSPTLYY